MTRTLAEAVRALSASELRTLLERRPDLTFPAPHDLSDLTSRALTEPSIARALDGLDAWQLAVLEVASATPDPASLTTLAGLLGERAEPVHTAVDELRRLALVWGADEALHVPRAVRAAFGPWPAGLAEPSPEPVPDSVLALTDALPDGPARLIDRLVWGPPHGTVRDAEALAAGGDEAHPVAWLLHRGLLRLVQPDTVALPREVALRLRDGRAFRDPVAVTAPAPLPATRDLALVDRAAVGAAWEMVHRTDVALDEIARLAPQPLRTGGLGKRDLTLVGRAVSGDVALAAGIVDTALAAGLLAADGARAVLPTRAYDAWLALPSPQRWHGIVMAWASLPGVADLARTLLQLTPGSRVDADVLQARFAWQHPRRPAIDTAALLDQATWFGLISLGHRSSLTLDPAPEGLAEQFPEPVEQFLIQSDLTAVGLGPLDHATRAVLRLLARQESHGGGEVFRFSAPSLQPALDAGWSVDAITAWLEAHSSTGVPQPLRYVLTDLGRRHGSVRLSAVTTLVRTDNAADAVQIAAHPGAAALGLRAVAPGVLVADADPVEVAALVRSMGLAPSAEDAAGTLIAAPASPRLPAPRSTPAPEPPDLDRLVTALQAAPSSSRPADLRPLLSRSITEAIPLTLVYVDADGVQQRARARVQQLSAGGVRVLVAGRPLFVPYGRLVDAAPAHA